MVWLSGILVYEKSAKVFQIPHGTAVKISAKSHFGGRGGAGQISYQLIENYEERTKRFDVEKAQV